VNWGISCRVMLGPNHSKICKFCCGNYYVECAVKQHNDSWTLLT
jgi:hypothetical protein